MISRAAILHRDVEQRSYWEAKAAKYNAITDNTRGPLSGELLRKLNEAENELAYWTAMEKDDRRDPYL